MDLWDGIEHDEIFQILYESFTALPREDNIQRSLECGWNLPQEKWNPFVPECAEGLGECSLAPDTPVGAVPAGNQT